MNLFCYWCISLLCDAHSFAEPLRADAMKERSSLAAAFASSSMSFARPNSRGSHRGLPVVARVLHGVQDLKLNWPTKNIVLLRASSQAGKCNAGGSTCGAQRRDQMGGDFIFISEVPVVSRSALPKTESGDCRLLRVGRRAGIRRHRIEA